ncbi:MAG TPA: PIN domain-containing protein [Longimicrobiaceae bacterium]|nr:PIN domain-containing protein [Longimicrobiaceae bacterium]
MLTLDSNVWVAAFDSRDAFHQRSEAFLRAVSINGVRLHSPAFVLVEVACASTRRARDPAVGRAVHDRLRRQPALRLHPLNDRCLAAAHEVGVRLLLRGADSLYVAVAEITDAPLVTWDSELVARAGAVTPEVWMAENC